MVMENITIEKMEIKRFNALLMRTIVGMLFMGVLMWETFTNGKTNCSIFKKHFVLGLPLLTQNKMCILLQKIKTDYSAIYSNFALNLLKV